MGSSSREPHAQPCLVPFPAPRAALAPAASASRQGELLAPTCDFMTKDPKIQFLKATWKRLAGRAIPMTQRSARRGDAARSKAVVMGCRKQSSGSCRAYSQPPNPLPTSCLQGSFPASLLEGAAPKAGQRGAPCHY